jgi:hypothetical protein
MDQLYVRRQATIYNWTTRHLGSGQPYTSVLVKVGVLWHSIIRVKRDAKILSVSDESRN